MSLSRVRENQVVGDGVAVQDGTAARTLPRPRGWRSRLAYAALAWVLVACVVIQVLLAGMGVFVSPARYSWHTGFVHVFEGLPILMVILSFSGRMPRRVSGLTVGMFVLIELQYLFIGLGESVNLNLAALHPVNALLIFWLSLVLARRGRRLWRERVNPTPA